MYENIKFQYYKNDVHDIAPKGIISLRRFLEIIKEPKKETRDLLLKIQQATIDGNLVLKSKLKEGLYGFTPPVFVSNGRKYEYVQNYTGLAILDFDKIDNATEFKEFIFNEYKHIIAAWFSPSMKGIKALVKIPIVKTKAEFKTYSYGLSAEFEVYKGFDIVVNNAVLLTFIGWDKDILIRDNPETWTQKGEKINDFELKPIKAIYNPTITSKQSEWVINWYSNTINSINDNGHPQVRDNSITLGGYVGSGYLSMFDAINLSESLISSNGYLRKGVSGYQKTARQSIQLGMTKPLTFNNGI